MLLPLLLAFATASRADIRPEKVYVAENRKTQTYIKDGLISGGDSTIQDVVIKDIRRAKNPLFDRIVIDLQGAKRRASRYPASPLLSGVGDSGRAPDACHDLGSSEAGL